MKNEHVLRFERMAQLITVAASKQNHLSLNDLMLNNSNVIFSVTFSDYVKSQIHLNIVSGLFGRSILEYKYTLDYLQGKVPLSKDVKNVLIYYYTDMLNFLANNEYDCNLKVTNDIPELQDITSCVVIDKVEKQFRQFITEVQQTVDSFDELYNVVSAVDFAEVIDYLDGIIDLTAKFYSVPTMIYLIMLLKEIKKWNI